MILSIEVLYVMLLRCHNMYYFVLVVFIFEGACGYLTIGPENIAVIQGTTVVMKCFRNNEYERVLWRRQKREGGVPDKVSISNLVNPAFSEIYHVNNSLPGQYDLIIRTDLSTGNQYICQEGPHGLEDGIFLSAELIVLESEPRCHINISSGVNNVITVPVNNSLQLQCTVKYSGNWEPTTEWKMLNSTVVIHDVLERTVLNDSVSLATILTVAYDTVIHGGRYVYELRFDESKRPNSTTAKNIPDYQYTWMSPTISMTFPKHDSATASKPEFTVILLPILFAVVLVIVITIFVLLKRGYLIRQQSIADARNVASAPITLSDLTASSKESEHPGEVEIAADISSSAEYTSLQRNFELEDAAYAPLNKPSSSHQTNRPTGTTMTKDKFNLPLYENVDHKNITKSKKSLQSSNYSNIDLT